MAAYFHVLFRLHVPRTKVVLVVVDCEIIDRHVDLHPSNVFPYFITLLYEYLLKHLLHW